MKFRVLSLLTTPAFTFALSLTSASAAVSVFDSNFDSSSLTPGSGAVTATADYGTVGGGGNWSVAGTATSAFGGIGGTTTDKALAVRQGSALAGSTDMPANSFTIPTSFPGSRTVDGGGGGTLLANFGSAAGFTTPGETTVVSLDWGMFGTSNTGAFKYNFIRGLSSTNQEVFEILMVAGSTDDTRDIFVRTPAQNTTSFTNATTGTPAGTNVVTAFGAGSLSTSLTAEPTTPVGVLVSLQNGTADFTFTFPGVTGSTSPLSLTGFSLPSGVTDLSKLEFSSAWGSGVNTQNKGYWLDNVSAVYTVPEPAGLLTILPAIGLLLRRRQPAA